MWGIDVDRAPTLIAACRRWGLGAEQAAGSTRVADLLVQLAPGVAERLDEAAADCRGVASTVQGAVDRLLDYRLHVDAVVNPLAVDRLRELMVAIRGSGTTRSWLDLATPARSASTGGLGEPRAIRGGAAGVALAVAYRDAPVAALVADLRKVLDVEFGAADPGATEWALLLLQQGESPEQVLRALADGAEALLDRVVQAVVDGAPPAEVDLPSTVFPEGYRRWHDTSQAIGDAQLLVEVLELARLGVQLDRLDTVATMRFVDMAAKLPEGHPLRQLSEASGTAGFGRLFWRAVDAAMPDLDRRYEQARADLELARVTQANIVIPTTTGAVAIGDDGALSTFEAIGAAVAAAGLSSGAFDRFVGRRYAESILEFDEHEVVEATQFIAAHSEAALAFYVELGPTATGNLLTDLGLGGPRLHESPVAINLSIALGLASAGLPAGFGAGAMSAQPEDEHWIGRVAPQVLLAHGEFDADFLIEAVAVTLIQHDGQTLVERLTEQPDYRDAALAAIARHDLGAHLVHFLAGTGDLDALIRPRRPIEASPHDPLAAVTRVLLQAGFDPIAADQIIAEVASSSQVLHLDVANGVSQVLAAQIERHVGTALDSTYFDAVRVVFDSGAGVDIDIAVRRVLDAAIIAQLRLPEAQQDWSEIETYAELLGRIEGIEFAAIRAHAITRDEATSNARVWLATLTSVGSVGLAVAPFAVGAGGAFAIAGVALTGLGWLFGGHGRDDHVEHALVDEWEALVSVDIENQALLIAAALAAGAVTVDGEPPHLVERCGDLIRVEFHRSSGSGGAVTVDSVLIDPMSDGWLGVIDGADFAVNELSIDEYLSALYHHVDIGRASGYRDSAYQPA